MENKINNIMYKLKIEAKSGEDLRNQLLALLGETGVTVQSILPTRPEMSINISEVLSEPQLEAVLGVEKAISDLDEALKEPTGQPVDYREQVAKEQQEAPKRIRRTKEQIAADEAANQNTEEQTPATGVTAPEVKEEKKEEAKKEVSSSLTEQDLVNQAIKLGAGKKHDIRAILKEYGVEKIPALDAKDYSAFMEKLKDLENLVEA